MTDKTMLFAYMCLSGMPASDALRKSIGGELSTGKGFYVYALIDPISDSVFYIGKGKGVRVKSHAKNARKGAIDNVDKHRAIKLIHSYGEEVKEVILFNAKDETEAFAVERELISLMADSGLTNISLGVRSNAEIAQERAKEGLSRLKSFDNWIATAGAERVNAAASLAGGCAKRFYDDFVKNLQQMANGEFGGRSGANT